ncbi:MAG TPA: hypothetical protein PLX50_07060, partial [Candidatus Aminicenantes bacterium]|nr:hypothetical protein [Candidatus Aminicenantes bacterium]
MTAFSSLLRAGLKSNFGLALLVHRLFKEKKDLWLGVLIVLAVIGALPALYYLILFLQNAYFLLKPLGQESALLTLGILAGQLFILLFGLYYVISAFYFSRDLEMLIPLPLKPFQVMTSKFVIILANEYLTVMIIVLPVFITFGVLSGGGLSYWAAAALIYAFLPVIPLAIVSLLVVAMMRIVNIGRKKDVLILAGSLVLIAAGLAAQTAMSRYSGSAGPDAQAMTAFLASPDSLLNRIGAGFPPSIWATKALASGFSRTGLAHLSLFAGTSLLLLVLMVIISEKLFYGGLIGLGEIAAKRRALSQVQMSRKISSGRRPVRAIFVREWRIMNRTPIFLLNGVLVVLLVPLIFILMAKTGGGGNNAFLRAVMTSAKPFHMILATAAFMTICGSLNGTSSSAFSREGGQFWISKVIPVSARDQVKAKFMHSYAIALLGILSASFAAAFFFHARPAVLAPAAALALAVAFILTAAGMIIDIARPLLDWTNPQ